MEEILNIVSFLTSNSKLKINYSVTNNFPKELFSDKKRIKQIILNLVTNAIKFTM
jgi:signal transduction histidine kinase